MGLCYKKYVQRGGHTNPPFPTGEHVQIKDLYLLHPKPVPSTRPLSVVCPFIACHSRAFFLLLSVVPCLYLVLFFFYINLQNLETAAVGKNSGREFRDLVVAQVKGFEGSFSLGQPRSVKRDDLVMSPIVLKIQKYNILNQVNLFILLSKWKEMDLQI